MRILVDLDDVLVDFHAGYARLLGISSAELRNRRTPGEWDLSIDLGISHSQFWKPVHLAGAQFWQELKACEWSTTLVDIVKYRADDWLIVSTPSTQSSSYVGKIEWMQAHFKDSQFNRYELIRRKYLLANRDTILIDDKEENCDQFIRAGGQAILFPSYGNRLYEHCDNPLSYIADVLPSVCSTHY